MKRLQYKDEKGRIWVTELPDGFPDTDASLGLPVGPATTLSELGLPEEIEARLHNELVYRELFTWQDMVLRTPDVVSALISALKVDAGRIIDLFRQAHEKGGSNGADAVVAVTNGTGRTTRTTTRR